MIQLTFKKIILILTILGILTLIIISQNLQNIESATIKEIYSSSGLTTIQTTDNQTLILFENSIDLKKGDQIEFIGSKEIYKGKEQIIIDKIWKIK